MRDEHDDQDGGMPTDPTTRERSTDGAPSRPTGRRRAGTPADFSLQPTLRRPAPELGKRARRSIDRILEATKEIFLARGYKGTSVDDIARAAGLSRASFYTYFPSKRDVLLALGESATREANEMMDRLREIPVDWTVADLEAWLQEYMVFLDRLGAFGVAWTQAAQEDDEIRAAGTKTHLATCRRLGQALDTLRGSPLGSPTEQGLLVFSMLDRSWSLLQLYRPTVEPDDMVHNLAVAIAAMLHRTET